MEKEIPKRKKHIIFKLFMFLIIIIACLFMYAKYLGPSGLTIKEYRVESSILSSNFDGIKIVHFSDLLFRSTIDTKDIKQLVNKINDLKPDIVVFTGDLVAKSKLTANDDAVLIENLSLIKANISKYAIYGDDDISYNDYENIMTSSGFTILNNSYDSIYYKSNEPIYIVGFPSSIKENIKLEEAFEFYSDEDRKYIICLVHEGKTIKYLDESTYEVDLVLGGHSLNGSIKLPYMKGLFVDEASYKYYDNEYIKGLKHIYISSGLGTRKYEYRFGNKPSFNLYRLKALSS